MKNFRLNHIVVLLTSVLIITSCSKKSDPKSRTELLTAKSWTETKAEVLVGSTYQDVTSTFIQNCSKDDIITFSKSFVYKFDTGKDDCSGDDPSETGTWAFKDGEKTISTTVNSSTEDVSIESLSDNTLVIKETYDFGSGKVTYRLTYTGK